MDLTSECRGDRATFSMIVHGLQNLRRMQILQSRADERDSMCGGRGKNVQDNPNPNPSKYHRATKAANPFLSVSTTTAVPRLRTGNFLISAFRPVYHDRTLSFTNDPGLQNLREIEILHDYTNHTQSLEPTTYGAILPIPRFPAPNSNPTRPSESPERAYFWTISRDVSKDHNS